MKQRAAPAAATDKISMPTTKNRISLNLAGSEYSALAELAEKNRLSMAWLGRQAVIEFLERRPRTRKSSPAKFRKERIRVAG